MENPLVITLYDAFNKDNKMFVTLMVKTGKKYRKIARGEINIYKKYFLSSRYAVEKWVFLELLLTQFEQIGKGNAILQSSTHVGKIYLKYNLLDPPLEEEKKNKSDGMSVYSGHTGKTGNTLATHLKANVKNISNIKDNVFDNKKEKLRSVTEKENEFLRRLKEGKVYFSEGELYEDIPDGNNIYSFIFINTTFLENRVIEEKDEDGLSDISISIIDGQEEGQIDIEKINYEIDQLIFKIKVLFEENSDNM